MSTEATHSPTIHVIDSSVTRTTHYPIQEEASSNISDHCLKPVKQDPYTVVADCAESI